VTFPAYLTIGALRLHPHPIFEVLAYFIGFRLYLRARRRQGDVIDNASRWSVVTAAAVGAAIGSKLWYWLEDPVQTIARWNDLGYLLAGKTIVGGLVGGLVTVELTKRWIGIKEATGDLFAAPLAIAIAVGRLGCFFTGLADKTYGVASSLPWAVDFGDGVRRHPTQLYEALFVLALAAFLTRAARRPHGNGDIFKYFMVAYMTFRFLVDALKPESRVAVGLSSLQWTALLVLAYYARDIRRWLTARP